MQCRITTLTVVLALLSLSLPVRGGPIDGQMLQAGSGVAHPSLNQSTGTNPAGLIEVDRFKLALGSGFTQSAIGDLSAGLLFGRDDSKFGGTVGIDLGNVGNQVGGNTTNVFLGAAAFLRGINTALGVSYTGAFNLGLIVNPTLSMDTGSPKLRFGATAYSINTTPSWGAGLEWDSGRAFSILADALADQSLNVIRLHPALLIGSGRTFFTAGYSFVATGGSGGEITLGVSMNIGSDIDWQFYFNQFDRLFLGVNFRL